MSQRAIWRGFASDNYAGVHPEVLKRIVVVNDGHEVAYGDDTVTEEFNQLVKKLFGSNALGFPVFNGTGANVVALQAALKRWEAVICVESAHIHVDEGGAPEKMGGIKLWTVSSPDGKLTPEMIDSQVFDVGFVHRAQPGVVSITQTTEMGTLYSKKEIKALAVRAHKQRTSFTHGRRKVIQCCCSVRAFLQGIYDRSWNRPGFPWRHQDRCPWS